jgi:hypothetical protein
MEISASVKFWQEANSIDSSSVHFSIRLPVVVRSFSEYSTGMKVSEVNFLIIKPISFTTFALHCVFPFNRPLSCL